MGHSHSVETRYVEDPGHAQRLHEIQEQMERMRLEAKRAEEENKRRRIQEAARHEEEMKREAKRIADENELRRAQEAVRQMEENMKMQEKIRKEQEEMQEKIRREQEEKQKLEEKIRREEEKRKMDEHARQIEEEARMRVEKEIWLREEAERSLESGIPPIKYPTGDDIQVVRERMQYQEGNLHIAITGISGSGKSSLINAFRGYSRKHQDAAKTGTRETTETIGRFGDPSRPWMFWYDVPGAGTLSVPDWQYFNDQGLYIFDIIIVAVDTRFTKIDAGLLFNCNRFGIPAFVVRSKSDQHIDNIIKEDRENDESSDEGDSGGDDSQQSTEEPFITARNKFVKDTRQEYASIFAKAGLPPQKVYIVSKDSIRSITKGSKSSAELIDEVDLIEDILHAANGRRHRNQCQD